MVRHKNEKIKGFVSLSAPFDIGFIIDRMNRFYQRFFIKSIIERTVFNHPVMKYWEEIGVIDFKKLRKLGTIR